MRRSICFLVLAGMCLLPVCGAQGQDQPEPSTPVIAGVHGHVEGLMVPQIAGQPFVATLQVEVTGKWADGTTVRTTFFNHIARDSQGRVYQERRQIVPMGSDKTPAIMMTFVSDTPNRTRTVCEVPRRVCTLTWFRPILHIVDEPVGQSRDGSYYLTREDLGTASLDDLDVIHSLETRTTNTGVAGNDRPMAATREFWYSPRLELNLGVTRTDPAGNVQKLVVTELKLEEPDAAWFAQSAGYTVVDKRVNVALPGVRH